MENKEIIEMTKKNYMQVFSRVDMCIEKGKGCYLYDTDGKKYLDMFAGIAVNNFGYSDKGLTKALTSQIKKIIHCSNFCYYEIQAKASEEILKDSHFGKVFFSNSGAEANECAIKLVRKYWYSKGEKRPEFITALNSFHGRTLATATATGQAKYSKPFSPLPTKFNYVPLNDIDAFENAISDKTGGVILEVIQGVGGVIPADVDYIKSVEKICKEKSILLIIDEVQTGIGRTGKKFGFENYDIKPDIISLAKALGGGIPIGATLATEEVAKSFTAGDHGSTFGGNPLACTGAYEVLKRLTPDFLKDVTQKGEYLIEKLFTVASKYDYVLNPRGKGLMVGLPLKANCDGKKIVKIMREKGFLIDCASSNTLRFIPPLTISTKQIDSFIKVLDETLSKVKE